LFNIYVVVHQDSYRRVKECLQPSAFEPDSRTTLTLVVVEEPETESAVALKLMQSFQGGNMPNFDTEELLIVEGAFLLDYKNYPLETIMNEHYLTSASMTSVVQEQNLNVKPQVKVEDDSYEIYCLCDFTQDRKTQALKCDSLKRMVLKTDSHAVKNL